MKARYCICLLTLAIVLLGMLCPAIADKQANGQVYIDATGKALHLGMDAKRIVSLAPNVTEMLYEVGLGDYIVGRTDYCDYPTDVQEVESIGGFVDTSLEKVIALQPDLVVAYQGNSLELIDQLRTAGITVLAFAEASTLDEICDQMATLYEVAGPPDAPIPAQLIIWQGRLSQFTIEGYPDATFFRCFFGYPGETTFTCGKASFVSDLMLHAGAVNVAAELQDAWPMVSAEFIISAQPEWILTGTDCTKDEDASAKRAEMLSALKSDPAWAALPAVRDDKLIVIDSEILLRPGPRVLDALRQLNRAFTERVVVDLTMELVPD